MPLSTGQKLAHYDVLELIGSGGMGEVDEEWAGAKENDEYDLRARQDPVTPRQSDETAVVLKDHTEIVYVCPRCTAKRSSAPPLPS